MLIEMRNTVRLLDCGEVKKVRICNLHLLYYYKDGNLCLAEFININRLME